VLLQDIFNERGQFEKTFTTIILGFITTIALGFISHE